MIAQKLFPFERQSVMHANNEFGTVQPIGACAGIAREHGIPFHSDAAQSVGKVPTRVDKLGVGVGGCAVDASFAFLVAEGLFELGCELLISITSGGEIIPAASPPYFILIDRALRDEGVKSHRAVLSMGSSSDTRLIFSVVDGPLCLRSPRH